MANTTIDLNSNNNEHLNERLDCLETRNAFQDDIIEQLNVELATHQEEIADLKYQLKLISGRIKELRPNEGGDNDVEPPPPHY
ncbi:MAG: SlyX family protein [Alteromonadaceae bacterium]|nr:SlyX family protein [Alteromonadaceae bacterium]